MRGVARLGDGCNSCVFLILWYFSGSEGQIVETSESWGDFLCSFFQGPSWDVVKAWALASV